MQKFFFLILIFSFVGTTNFDFFFFQIFLYCFGAYVFDEARSAKQNPHKHLYTRIRGKWYDLATFTHPGGPVALNLVKDRDGTALFESHHLIVSSNKMQKLLAKYEVNINVAKNLKTMDPNDDGAHYIWEEFHDDLFVKDLKQLLSEYFGSITKKQSSINVYQATKADTERWCFIGFLFVSVIITSVYFYSGYYWALILWPQLSWILIANYWHDSLHFSLSTDWRVNAILPYFIPLLSSPWIWYHQHVIGHHAYTNIGHKDPDLAHAPQLMREHESIKWKPAHRNQSHWSRIALIWSVSVGIGLNVLSDLRANLKLKYNNVVPYAKLSKPRMMIHIFGRFVYVALIFLWPFLRFHFWKAVVWSVFPIASFGISFMINSQINHLVDECSNASDTNFLIHQVKTAQNFGRNSLFCYLYSGGLNYQIEHHLFPFVNHCHLPKLAPSVKHICLKHGVPYHEAEGYFDAFKRHILHTQSMGKNPSKEKTN